MINECDDSISEILDELIGHWADWPSNGQYYLHTLIPSLMERTELGDEKEQQVVRRLTEVLDREEWTNLPQLVEQRCVRRLEEQAQRREEKMRRDREYQALRAQQRREEEEREKERSRWRAILSDRLGSDYLACDDFYVRNCTPYIQQDEYDRLKAHYVTNWVREQTEFTPDHQQAAAIGAIGNNYLVVARAGSGKTATIVYRTLFLLRHCNVSATEILLLAFNRKAAFEMNRRLLVLLVGNPEHQRRAGHAADENELDAVVRAAGVALPHIMTFHALAYAVVHPEGKLLYDGADGDDQSFSRTLQRIREDHLPQPEFQSRVRRVMLQHFREDWERIIRGGYDRSSGALLQFRRSLPYESIDGKYVKSYGEKVIADFLFEHGIQYQYEASHSWNGINYRPDFTIYKIPEMARMQRHVVIEYFGISGDAHYDEMIRDKRNYWSNKSDWTLVELRPEMLQRKKRDNFEASIRRELESRGVVCHRVSEDQMWKRVKDRAIDRFTKSMARFVQRCRTLALSPDDLVARITRDEQKGEDDKTSYLELAAEIYAGYMRRLKETREDDFSGLLQKAIEKIRAGHSSFTRKREREDLRKIRFILIDEYQDISCLFDSLISIIRQTARCCELFCVGDDWQAINRFAGSDLKYYEKFGARVSPSVELMISKNYRSRRAIVEMSNALMYGKGDPASAAGSHEGSVVLVDLDHFELSEVERARHKSDECTAALLRVIHDLLYRVCNVVLLTRRNSSRTVSRNPHHGTNEMVGYLDHLHSFLPKEVRDRVSISTVHKYKGLESPAVVLIDVNDRSYPLIHRDWIFLRILGEDLVKIVEEERRLFYVALTRAVNEVVIVTRGRDESPFLKEIRARTTINERMWDSYPIPESDGPVVKTDVP